MGMKSFRALKGCALKGFWGDEESCGEVWIYEDDKPIGKLDARLDVLNKSPTGFAWGYGGSGPAQLAFALLAAVVGVERASEPQMFQNFKWDVIGRLDQAQGWKITEGEIREWIEQQP
jgi:Family of unknown function (DUF6166)